jgi:alkylhydroperoxidase family enzyme
MTRRTPNHPKFRAATQFAVRIVDTRDHVSDTDVKVVHDAAYRDEQIVEILARVALNLFTNYANNVLAVDLDFPATRLRNAV